MLSKTQRHKITYKGEVDTYNKMKNKAMSQRMNQQTNGHPETNSLLAPAVEACFLSLFVLMHKRSTSSLDNIELIHGPICA